MSWCVILHIMAKETHLEAKNSFVILPAGMANQFPAFLSSILFVYQFFCHVFLLRYFFFFFSVFRFVCCFLSVIFPVGMENQFPVFPSHYRQFACADAPLSTNSSSLESTGKKTIIFFQLTNNTLLRV